MQLCIFKFMFLHLPLLRLTRPLAPSLCPIAVNIKLQQFSMTRLDWSRRRELHFGNGWGWGVAASQPVSQAGRQATLVGLGSDCRSIGKTPFLRSNNRPVGGSGPSYYELLQQIASKPATSTAIAIASAGGELDRLSAIVRHYGRCLSSRKGYFPGVGTRVGAREGQVPAA